MTLPGTGWRPRKLWNCPIHGFMETPSVNLDDLGYACTMAVGHDGLCGMPLEGPHDALVQLVVDHRTRRPDGHQDRHP